MANYFTDRVVEFPGRIKLTEISGQTDVYDMERAEGAVITPGTPFNAPTFNDIAQSILDACVSRETPYYTLDTTASSGTTDGDLYAAITSLGWASDVIV